MNKETLKFKLKAFVLGRPVSHREIGSSALFYSKQPSGSFPIPRPCDLYRPYTVVEKTNRRVRTDSGELRAQHPNETTQETHRSPSKRQKTSSSQRVTFRPKIHIPAVRLVSRTTKPKKKRLSWGASNSPDVAGYRLYWAVGRGVDYEAEHADIGKVNTILLPDDISSFPLVAGQVEVGVTALSPHGNESDMLVISASVDFTAPEPPENLRLEET
jgi:hypothetical protein